MFFLAKIITTTLALLTGIICLTNPGLAIKIQQRFYEKINWRIEPINLNLELRNTRIMGLINLILAMLIIIQLIKK